MTEENIQKLLNEQTKALITHLDERVKEVHERLDAQDERINAIYNLLDADAARRVKDDEERATMGRQLARQQTWIEQVATHTGVELAPEQ
jgi:hypothetical protein